MIGSVMFGPGPAAAEDRPMLRQGSSGDAVLVLEQRLIELGFGVGVVDTYFDANTRTGVVTFQRAAGIGQDGIVGPITWSALDRGAQNPGTPAPPPPAPPSSSTSTSTSRPTLRPGSSGDAVLALEQQLSALGYWVDTVDGTFGSATHHAIVALQKAAGIGRDGIVGPITWGVLDAGTRPAARTTSGHAIEIDLTRQLLLVVDNGAVREIHDTSTGRVAGTTPAGAWTISRQVDGYRSAPLGVLYRPKYFYGGVAIHGHPSVPPYPASHAACV
jgi:peptidoglycan hydrolase-like protein with peptidoglycan-binding domain